MSKKQSESTDPLEPTPDQETIAPTEPAPSPAPASEPPSVPTVKTYTEAEFQAAVAKAQKEGEKKAAAAEAKSKLAEDERTKLELEEARAAIRERDTRDSVLEQSGKDGVRNPKLFYNAYKNALEIDDKGKITNFKEVLAAAKTESPELFTSSVTTAPQPQGGADGGEGKNTNTGNLTKEMIEKMSPDEIAANMDRVDAFLASPK